MFQVLKSVLNNLRQVVRQMPVSDPLEIVVVRILSEPPVDERPRQIVHGILFVLYGLSHNLRIEVIMQAVVQVALKYFY